MATDQIPADSARGPGAQPGRAGTVLGNRDFVKLWIGETISLMGTQVTSFALPLVAIITLNASVFQVGLLAATKYVPVIALSLLAGVWLDRRRRRPVLIACALGSAVLIGLVPLSSVTGLLSIGLLYVVNALVGTLNMVFDIGALSYVPSLVEPRHLRDGNSKLQASDSLAGVAGPGLAGFLVGLLTAPIALSVDAVSYLFTASGLISISRSEPAPQPPADRPSVWQSIAEGLRTVYGSRLLRTMLAQSTAVNLFYGAFNIVLIVYAVRYLHLSPVKLGVVVAAAAVGGLTGALTATRVTGRVPLGRALAVSTILTCAAPMLMLIPRGAGPVTMTILVAAQLLFGVSMGIFNVNAVTLRQTVTPNRLLGRMNATYRMVLFGSAPFGTVAGGLLGNAFGLRTAFVISVIAMACPALCIFFLPLYRLTEMPVGPPDEPAGSHEPDLAAELAAGTTAELAAGTVAGPAGDLASPAAELAAGPAAEPAAQPGVHG
jgi:MFS family permease